MAYAIVHTGFVQGKIGEDNNVIVVYLNILDLDCTTQETSPTSSNKTDFLSRNSGTGDRRGFSDMLVVTTTMRMVHGVHSNTTSTGPVVTLGLVFVVCPASFEERLVDTSTTGDDANSCTSTPRDSLLRTTRQPYAGLVLIRLVSDNGCVVSGCTRESTTIADLLLNVADNGTFRALSDRENVPNSQSGLFAAVDKGASVEAFGRDEGLFLEFVAVGVTENDSGEGSTTARVVDDLLHDSTNVAITFSKVERTKASGSLVKTSVRFEDGVRSPLCPNDPTHCLFYKDEVVSV